MAFAVNGCPECAFLRAKEILRTESALTRAECEELDRLFEVIDATQYIALTQDTRHERALREYHGRTPVAVRLIVTMMTMLFVVSVVMGVYAGWHH